MGAGYSKPRVDDGHSNAAGQLRNLSDGDSNEMPASDQGTAASGIRLLRKAMGTTIEYLGASREIEADWQLATYMGCDCVNLH